MTRVYNICCGQAHTNRRVIFLIAAVVASLVRQGPTQWRKDSSTSVCTFCLAHHGFQFVRQASQSGRSIPLATQRNIRFAEPDPPKTLPATDEGGDETTDPPQAPKVGWAVWPPTSLQDVFNLYGGPRRFFLVNIPAALLALGADFLGSMRALLSLDILKPAVRSLRLDGVYAVRGLKRHYIDAPLFCTFAYPGDWVYDPSLEMARQLRKDGPTYSMRGTRMKIRGWVAMNPQLPLVALEPQSSPGPSPTLALYAQRAGQATSLAQALGQPEAGQAMCVKLAMGTVAAFQGKEVTASVVKAGYDPPSSAGGRSSYRCETQVSIDSTVSEKGNWTAWTSVQLAPSSSGGRQSYLLLLQGIAPATASFAEKEQIQAASESLDGLEVS